MSVTLRRKITVVIEALGYSRADALLRARKKAATMFIEYVELGYSITYEGKISGIETKDGRVIFPNLDEYETPLIIPEFLPIGRLTRDIYRARLRVRGTIEEKI